MWKICTNPPERGPIYYDSKKFKIIVYEDGVLNVNYRADVQADPIRVFAHGSWFSYELTEE